MKRLLKLIPVVGLLLAGACDYYPTAPDRIPEIEVAPTENNPGLKITRLANVVNAQGITEARYVFSWTPPTLTASHAAIAGYDLDVLLKDSVEISNQYAATVTSDTIGIAVPAPGDTAGPYKARIRTRDVNNQVSVWVVSQEWGITNEADTPPPPDDFTVEPVDTTTEPVDTTTPPDTATPPPATGDLIFVADAETGDESQWCYVHSAVPVGVTTERARAGSYSYKVEIQDGAYIYSSERSEYSNGPNTDCDKVDMFKLGMETYTAVSVYIPADFPSYSAWSLVTQWKGPHTGTPPQQIGLNYDTWEIIGEGRNTNPRPRWTIHALERGKWADFIVRHYWHTDPAQGWFEVWYNGVKVINKTFAQTMYDDNGVATPLFLSVGHYRDSSHNTDVTLYVDEVRVGTTLESVMLQ